MFASLVSSSFLRYFLRCVLYVCRCVSISFMYVYVLFDIVVSCVRPCVRYSVHYFVISSVRYFAVSFVWFVRSFWLDLCLCFFSSLCRYLFVALVIPLCRSFVLHLFI